MGMIIDGISASEHLDSSGEVLKISGHDISDLVEGKGVLNFEHNNDSPEDIIGAITYAKKIMKKSDCEDERQKVFWDLCKVPFIYIKAELFDDENHPGAICAAALIRYYHKRGLKMLAGFSVEGATLDKDGNVLKRSVGRRVALTLRPCNKSAISDVLSDPKNDEIKKFMQLDKPIIGKAYEVSDIIFSDMSKGERGDWQKEGYYFKHNVKKNGVHVFAYSSDGQQVGEFKFKHTVDPISGNDAIASTESFVEGAHVRKGIATAAYLHAEKISGRKVIPQYGNQTQDGVNLWNQPNRPFGKSEHQDKLEGGRADKKKPSQFNTKDLEEGIAHETEHTKDRSIAQEIAMDHLTEDPLYYKKLKTIEKSEKHLMRNRLFATQDGLEKADLPTVKTPSHSQKIRDIADSYMQKVGKTMVHNSHQVEVHPEMAAKVAQAYHEMPHTPNDPATQKAYNALINETRDQYEHLKQNGFRFTPVKGSEGQYKNSKEMASDVHNNNHLYYFPTEQGFGSGDQFKDHPLLQKVKTSDGEMVANDLFRAVHDVFGHAKEGNGFGPKGEENAYRHHMQMYSPEAQRALTSETRGQNSWVNFGPHGEANRADPANTTYADQKAGLMPEWTMGMWNGVKKSEDPLAELRATVSNLKKTLTAGGANAAPSTLTGGDALAVEHVVSKKKKGLKPESEKKLKSIIAAWDGKTSLAATIKAALPEVSENYIDHFANLAEEYTLKKAVNHIEHCDNHNASIAQDNLITGINVFAHEGKDRFYSTNSDGKPVLVVCTEEDAAKRATKFYEFVSTMFPKYSAMVPLTNYLKHTALAGQCAYVQLLPEDHKLNTITNPDYYADFRRDSWILHGFAMIDLISGAYQDRSELRTLCGEPPLFMGNTSAFYYDNFGNKPFYLKLIGNELLHLEAVQLLESVDPVELAVFARYSLQLNTGEIKMMVSIAEKLKSEYHGKTITQLFNIITDGIKNEA